MYVYAYSGRERGADGYQLPRRRDISGHRALRAKGTAVAKRYRRGGS